ncbi:MAG TPA: YncE family protein [Candidatus Binatia bacterium]|nr:YncE family protein [Candidatus Binatia bacterium]
MRFPAKLGLVIAAVCLAWSAAPAGAAKPPLCTDGRFAVVGGPLIGPGGEVIVLANRTVAIGSLCAAKKAKLKRTKLGTRLTVKFKKGGCTGVTGKVRLRALVSENCTKAAGTLKAGSAAAVSFTANASACGDQVVDTGLDEQCDGSATGCMEGETCSGDCKCVALLTRPSKSGTIAITEDEELVVMVNPDDDSISVFRTADNIRVGKITTGDEPSAVVLAADSTTAFVANRAGATVVRVRGIDGTTPTVSTPIAVGSEPTGLALSPTGRRLYVAEFAEGRVSVIDTTTLAVVGSIDGPENPHAVAVTNDGDADDDDELIVVPEFFGEPNANGEAKDTGRTGRVRLYRTNDLGAETAITFSAKDSGFPAGGVGSNPTIMTSPNQLWSAAIRDGRIYVPSVSASPEGPPRFDNNVFAFVWVGDLDAKTEVNTPDGSTNLTRRVVDSFTAPPARFVLGDIVDMDFIPDSNVSYVVSRGADCVQRVTWGDSGVTLGSATTRQINVIGNATIGNCFAPTGIALKSDATRAYVNCWVSRRLGVIDLTTQALSTTVESSPQPGDALGLSVQRGKRFYNTGRGRWSFAGGTGAGGLQGPGGNGTVGGEGWSSCATCHPDGLTDNITWVFATGPRQTVSQDGSFSHGAIRKQRVFNHTGIFDEHHDFEGNTRGVSGGLGAITTGASPADCMSLTTETQVTLQANLGTPMKEVADDPAQALCGHEDWDDIDNFVQTIRPPGRIRTADAASVANGRALFQTGGCQQCHGGPGWTLSRRFFTPSSATNATLASTAFTAPGVWVATWSYGPRNQISVQPIIPADPTGPAEGSTIAPAQVACVLRNVGTFGVPGDTTATDALEKKADTTRAQGRGGYNVPSLYGLALGRPYFHHGQAETLGALFTSSAYDFHTNAGNANFSLTLGADEVTDLTNFLLSIDADEPEIAPPANFDGCPP